MRTTAEPVLQALSRQNQAPTTVPSSRPLQAAVVAVEGVERSAPEIVHDKRTTASVLGYDSEAPRVPVQPSLKGAMPLVITTLPRTTGEPVRSAPTLAPAERPLPPTIRVAPVFPTTAPKSSFVELGAGEKERSKNLLFALQRNSELPSEKAKPTFFGSSLVFASTAPATSVTGPWLDELPGPCPEGMADVDHRFCVDRYEASLVEILPGGTEQPWSPYVSPKGHTVRAVSQAGRIPQGYISGELAEKACAASGKRLCSPREWRTACKGPERLRYGYSNANEPRRCNDYGRGPVTLLFGRQFDPANQKEWTFDRMNAPELNQVSGTLSPTGAHPDCTNGFGVYDMVGNLHEWVSDREGTFQGGYYQDTHINGEGCDYTTKAHNFTYQDYSTGFRCCADATP